MIATNKDKLNSDHIKYLVYEIMKGVLFIHSKGVIHRNIKPSNILVTESWDVKLNDFSISNVVTDDINKDFNLTN